MVSQTLNNEKLGSVIEMSAAEKTPQTVAPRLVAVAGSREGEIFELDGAPLAIGRQSSNRIKLQHEAVSRRHCIVETRPDGVWLRDLKSLCGTYVNGVPIKRRRLAPGDFIKIGDTLFIYLEEADDTEASPGPARSAGSDVTIQSTAEIASGSAFYLIPDRVRAVLQKNDATARHLAILLEASAEVQTARGVDELVRRLAGQVFEVTPAERAAVLLLEAGDLDVVHTVDRQGAEAEPQISRSLARRVLEERVAVLSDDLDDLLDETGASGAKSLEGTRLTSLLSIPLVAFDRPLGVLWAETSTPAARLSREHLELLTALAGLAAPALANARHTAWLEAENRRFRNVELDHELVGESPAMERILEHLARVAPTDLTVLVLGESGTGKELIAKAIHRNSPRTDQPFIAVNCATLSETLLESELFGHEKGAFTGAVDRKIGHFELAHEGTIFLDEVGEIPLPLQARLLRALEMREIQRVGGTRTIPVDVRVVAATNRDLATEIRQRTFREDLYHRLNIFSLTLPPLRERHGDLPLLANHFTALSARRLKRPVRGLTPETHAAITAYPWPGNVRELKNALERAVVLATGELLRPEDLPEAILDSAATNAPGGAAGSYHESVTEAKRQILRQAIHDTDGNIREAAERLGLNRTYLHRLLTQLGIRTELES